MEEFFSRAVDQLLGRAGGPLHIRLIFQPVVATILAIRAGLRDARTQQPAFLWALVSLRGHRHALMASAWKDIGKVFTLAFVLDTVYQLIELRWLYPVQGLIVACVLAIVPYVLVRGPVCRILKRRASGPDSNRLSKSPGPQSTPAGGPGFPPAPANPERP